MILKYLSQILHYVLFGHKKFFTQPWQHVIGKNM